MTRRILVVEDQEDNRRIMHDLLVNAGFEVIEALSGDEAVATAASAEPDLILMDIQLPGIDGLEATRRIRSETAPRQVPIIAVTSYAMSDDNQKALEAGCDAYFAKPVSPKTLLAKIREFLP
ncbi:MAG: response regulator [Alphaproteobacteria bacterium]|jgi:two-component system cell cycle response regulator DivK|nr:response regulator [Alphaproteobacteria bacterium]